MIVSEFIKLLSMPTQVDVAQIKRTAELMRENEMFALVPDIDWYANKASLAPR